MTELKILLADDEKSVLVYLESILKQIPQVNIIAKATTLGQAKKEALLQKPDIAILDIEFPEGTGIGLAKDLLEIYPDLELIFVTGHDGFTLEAIELYCFDYILKPIDEERVIQTINRLKWRKRDKSLKSHKLVIESGKDMFLVDMKNILYLESQGRKVLIHSNTRSHELYCTLKELETKLTSNFVRSHKSFIVNTDYIETIKSETPSTYSVTFRNHQGTALISKTYYREVVDRLTS